MMPPIKLGPSKRRSLWGGVVVTGAGVGVVTGAFVVLFVGVGGVGLGGGVGGAGFVVVEGVVGVGGFTVVVDLDVVGAAEVVGVVTLGVVPSEINIRVD